jgi:hypothetical protein
LRSTLPGETPTEYVLYFAYRYYNCLFALISLMILQLTFRSTDYPLCCVCRYYNRLSALLCQSILQPTIHSTDYPLYSLWLYFNRPSAVIFSACPYYNRLSYILYSALSTSITTTDYPLCSEICSETATASFRSETERRSAQLYLAILQPTIWCASLLPLSNRECLEAACITIDSCL